MAEQDENLELKVSVTRPLSFDKLTTRLATKGFRASKVKAHRNLDCDFSILKDRPPRKLFKFLWQVPQDPLYVAAVNIIDPTQDPGSAYSNIKKFTEETGFYKAEEVMREVFGIPQRLSVHVYGGEHLEGVTSVMQGIARDLGIDKVNIGLVCEESCVYVEETDWLLHYQTGDLQPLYD